MPGRDIRVFFVGDSFVAGVGDESGLGWVGRVLARAAAAGTGVTGYNLGVRGETSIEVVERMPRELAPRTRVGEARVVLSFGINDTMRRDGVRRVEQARSLDALSDAVRAAGGVPVAMVGPPSIEPGE